MHLSDFWREYHGFFNAEDGSLPEIRITGVSDASLPRLFDALRERADSLSDAGIWDLIKGEYIRVADVPNAAALVAAGTAESFHVLLRTVRIAHAELPELGLFVMRGEAALDYQPGSTWDEKRFYALLELVCELSRLAPEAHVGTEPEVVESYRLAFEREVERYCHRDRVI